MVRRTWPEQWQRAVGDRSAADRPEHGESELGRSTLDRSGLDRSGLDRSGLRGLAARLAGRDPLTGLADRAALERGVRRHLQAHARRHPGGAGGAYPRPALLLLDLNRFRRVNTALGHRAGDRLLIEVARRLAAAARPGDLVARLGGDEFAVLAPGLGEPWSAHRHATRILDSLSPPVTVDGVPIEVSASVGVAVHPEHGADFASLLQHAEVAMYEAKRRGDAVAMYAPQSDRNTPRRLALLGDLRHRLATDDPDAVALYYQPQVELDTGRVVGVEALARWCHPDRGLVDPHALAGEVGHTAVNRMLAARVVDDVIAQLGAWRDAPALRVAVNVDTRELHTGDVVDRIADGLARHRVPPERLQVEVTGRALMSDPRRLLLTLTRLRRLGVATCLDDFGAGYSSMLSLRRLPLSEVKIDRSFVLGVITDEVDAAIVRGMVGLAKVLGLRVAADGVDDDRTWRALAAAGCDVAQGWFCARPMPARELTDWLARSRDRGSLRR